MLFSYVSFDQLNPKTSAATVTISPFKMACPFSPSRHLNSLSIFVWILNTIEPIVEMLD